MGAVLDFDQLLRETESNLPTDPREVYDQLPDKAQGWGYLRDVQAQILTQWHERRDDRDLVIKVNTGGGKTIDGLVILQSYLNEGVSPALYVAPDKYLVAQVLREAGKLGIPVTDNPESSAYLSGEAVGVVTAAKLFNGHTVFSDHRPSQPRVPIGAVVIDDAHAVMATLRSQLSMTIPRSNATYDKLLTLFEPDLKLQSPDVLLDIQEETGGSFARVPFWSSSAKIDELRRLLRDYEPANALDFSLDAVRDVLELSRIVFTRFAVTIVPPCPPIGRITSFAEAQRRVFLTATLANDSALVSDFDADPSLVEAPIQPITAGDIGERMILAPEEINASITAEEVRAAIVDVSKRVNVFVIVPSNLAMKRWNGPGVIQADASNIKPIVDRMRSGEQVGLVVAANKYDGIDLPQDACRILVIDGLPESFSGDERLEALMQTSVAGIDDRQVQRLEQGMGRAVRSNEDHCVVFLLGRRLAQLTVDPRTLDRFSPATRAQLGASRTMARRMEDTPLSKIMETAQQALDRDPGWTKYAKQALRALDPSPARVDASAAEMRKAFDDAVAGDLARAAERLVGAAESCGEARVAGQLLEQAAAYFERFDPMRAQEVLAIARTKNPYVLRPMAGVSYRPLGIEGTQANRVSERLTARYGTATAMRVAVEGFLEQLNFDPMATEEFEEALFELGLFLGFGSQRPERELGNGPDNLWALEPGKFWVIEAKSGATSEFISKRDAGQLSQSMLWFGGRYPAEQSATPIMVRHNRKLYSDASPPIGMKVITTRVLAELRASIAAFSEGLAAEGWKDAGVVDRLLEGHRLKPNNLMDRVASPTGGTA